MNSQRLAWAITGSGHYIEESLAFMLTLDNVDLYLSQAGEEVLKMYGIKLADIQSQLPVYRDKAASAPPVGLFYKGWIVCHSRRNLHMNPVATWSAVDCWLRIFAPRLSSALPAASKTLWKVIKDALKSKRVCVSRNNVKEVNRAFAVCFKLFVGLAI